MPIKSMMGLIVVAIGLIYFVYVIIVYIDFIFRGSSSKYSIKLKKGKANKPFSSYLHIRGLSPEFVARDRRLIETLVDKFFLKDKILVALVSKYRNFFSTERAIELPIHCELKEEALYSVDDILWLYTSRGTGKFFDLFSDCWRKGADAEIVLFGVTKTELTPFFNDILHIKRRSEMFSIFKKYPQSIQYLFSQSMDGFVLQISFSKSSDTDLGCILATSCADMVEKEFISEGHK